MEVSSLIMKQVLYCVLIGEREAGECWNINVIGKFRCADECVDLLSGWWIVG